jgi:hypothetical protein
MSTSSFCWKRKSRKRKKFLFIQSRISNGNRMRQATLILQLMQASKKAKHKSVWRHKLNERKEKRVTMILTIVALIEFTQFQKGKEKIVKCKCEM